MKWSALLALSLLAAPGDDLHGVSVKDVEISLPRTWQPSKHQNTVQFTAPDGEAFLEADVGKVKAGASVSPQACVEQLIHGIGGKDWRARAIGNAPAALKVDVDTDLKGIQFVSYTYVGCDGRTTWALSFHWVGSKDQQLAPLAERMAGSLKYLRPKAQ